MQAANRRNEIQSLSGLLHLAILDTDPEPEFDALVAAAATLCATPVALISLVDADRQWLKANFGLPGVRQTPRDVAFCAHTVLEADILEVPDAAEDRRFAGNPLVTGSPHIRFYAGVPLRLGDGSTIGTLCVIDRVPRRLDDAQRLMLRGLGLVAAHALEGRRAKQLLERDGHRGAQPPPGGHESGIAGRHVQDFLRHAHRSHARPALDRSVRAATAIDVAARSEELLTMAAAIDDQNATILCALQSITDAVITTDVVGDIVWLNTLAESMTGWSLGEARGRPLSEIYAAPKDQRERHLHAVGDRLVDASAAAASSRAGVLRSCSGREWQTEESVVAIRNAHGQTRGLVVVLRDVSEQLKVSDEMRHRATHDALTDLLNRSEFERRLTQALQHARDAQVESTLLFLDLDGFKLINDVCGRPAGDHILQQTARLLVEDLRSGDVVARFEGDEFAVILPACKSEQAMRVAQKVCDRLDAFRFIHEDRKVRIGTSIGLVALDTRWESGAAALQAGENACIAASEDGGNRVRAWSDADQSIHERHGAVRWASRIEQALDEERFVLFAQAIHPISEHATRALHAEVLLRLADDDGTLISPGEFLPAAERFHLATRIDRWVLRKSIAWLKALPSSHELATLSVNLSGQSVGDRSFHAWVAGVLEDAGAAACRRLCFEITETAAVTNLADAASFVDQVHAAGVRVSLDDFGSGAASFGYLKRLKVDYLKIDGQFVRTLLSDALDDAAVRCFVDVARVLNIKTVAEFVDQPPILSRLRELGVDFAQGYLLHRPAPIDELLGLKVADAGLVVAEAT